MEMNDEERDEKDEKDNSSSVTQQESENVDECPICYQKLMFETVLPNCGHKFCFLCIKGVALRNSLCPLCRKRIPRYVFCEPILLTVAKATKPNEVPHQLSDEVQWFYKARGSGWWRYERRHEDEIEEAYQRGLQSIDVLIAGNVYCINFEKMIQHKKYSSRRSRYTREIKRVGKGDLFFVDEIRGIAGLRKPTESNSDTEQGRSDDVAKVAVGINAVNLNPK